MHDHSPGSVGRFLTVAEAAELLRLETAEVYALLHSGELRGIVLGSPRSWRIETAEMESFIAARYEEARRHVLWHGAAYADVLEFVPPRAP